VEAQEDAEMNLAAVEENGKVLVEKEEELKQLSQTLNSIKEQQ
jgi:hypothetical protein